MHFPADAVSAERADRGEATFLDVPLYGVPDVADAVALAGDLERFEEALLRDIDETLCLRGDLPDTRGERAVGLPAVENQTTVD